MYPILYNGILFDRLIGAFKITANVGFFMYIVDAFGYLSSVGILLYKNFGNQSISWLQFYTVLCHSWYSWCLDHDSNSYQDSIITSKIGT
ncbi:MAG: hypothetical protein IPO37_09700 [Saprospiraceae bacterium]|nr:hypothetical protein [Saprospiraceae bacterium]